MTTIRVRICNSWSLWESPFEKDLVKARRVFMAQMLLVVGLRNQKRVVVPTKEEWIGVNLLDCDGEL